jgi:hypothetical protein
VVVPDNRLVAASKYGRAPEKPVSKRNAWKLTIIINTLGAKHALLP